MLTGLIQGSMGDKPALNRHTNCKSSVMKASVSTSRRDITADTAEEQGSTLRCEAGNPVDFIRGSRTARSVGVVTAASLLRPG